MSHSISNIVDTHCHIISDDPQQFPVLDPMGGKQSDWSKERPVNSHQMVQNMKDAGVSKSVLVQASTCYGHDSSYVVQGTKDHPEAFVGVFSVDFLDPAALDQVQLWSQKGLSGLRLFIAGHTAQDDTKKLDDPKAFALWDLISSQQIPVCVQIRSNGLPSLKNLLTRFPKAIVLLDHFARPDMQDGPPYASANSLFELAKFEHLHFKLTTHIVRDSALGLSDAQSFFKKVVDTFGAKRIAWGSNFPANTGSLKDHLTEALKAAALVPLDEQEWVFSKTAHQLYPHLKLIQGV
jgi:predicted TIM-barrel fold metal-dependent hydrolase